MITFIAVTLLAILCSPIIGLQFIIEGKCHNDPFRVILGLVLILIGTILCALIFK